MRDALPWLILLMLALTGCWAGAQFEAPAAVPVDEADQKLIRERSQKLHAALTDLRRQGVRDPILADVAIYAKAVDWQVRHNEFFKADAAKQTLAVLDRGLLRASQAARGESPWYHQAGRASVRAYRSRIDGSLQPYAVTFPADYGQEAVKRYRIDVVLHGRDATLNEVKFLASHDGSQDAPKEQTWVQIDIFGRGNNAYRWAGETDVLEVMDHFSAIERELGRGSLLDPARVVLRGFSMGGAGSWHLGLHRPDRWCVVGPGAGFSFTKGYWKDLPEPLPGHQEATLHIYDALDYAENAANVPIVAYAGEDDPQIAAGRAIEKRLKELQLPMTFLVAPKTQHAMPREWQAKAQAEYAKHVEKGRPDYPEHIRFVTYTLKYPGCDWVQLLALEKHYSEARVEAQRSEQGYTIRTRNVQGLRITPSRDQLPPTTLTIDGQKVPMGRFHRDEPVVLYVEKVGEKWRAVLPQKLLVDRQRQPRKITGLTGPIDDAFTDAFVCVRPTGEAWHADLHRRAEADLARFQAEWSQFLRGDLPIKADTDVTAEDIASRHLILFGDPHSNALIGQILDRLPVKWTQKTVSLAGREGDAETHFPVLIVPNPLNPTRYVVLNSGHTFRAEDWKGTNARLYPRLGDYALLKAAPTPKDPLAVEVVTAGLFDDAWALPAKP